MLNNKKTNKITKIFAKPFRKQNKKKTKLTKLMKLLKRSK